MPRDGRPGVTLAEARKAAGRSIEDVAIELCISPKHLGAIEANEFNDMGGATYVKGYLRAYARSVGLDPEAVVADYVALGPKEHVLTVREAVEKPPRNNLGLLIGAAVVTALLIAGLSVWLLGGHGDGAMEEAAIDASSPSSASQWIREAPPLAGADSAPPAASEPRSGDDTPPADSEAATEESGEESSEEPIADKTKDASESEKEAGPDESGANEKNAPEARVAESGSKPATSNPEPRGQPAESAPKTTPARATPAPTGGPGEGAPIFIGAGKDTIEIDLAEDSWIQIQDSHGAVLLQGLYTAGAHRNLQGKAPFQVFLGNAPGVTIRFNGKEFDSSSFVRGNNTARFALVAQ